MMNNKYFFFILFLVNMPFYGIAGKDYKTVETLTLRLYEEKKWDSLIIAGKQALKDDIDYYFLRMRLGIAYYSKTKYIPASSHFLKATEFNSSDPVAWDYLYSSYVLANRNSEASAMVSRMPANLQKKFKKERNLIELITLEGGPTFSSDNKTENTLDIASIPGPYGEKDLYGNSYYGKLGLLMNLSNVVNLKVEYSYLNFSKTKYFQYWQFDNILESRENYWYGYSNVYNFSPTLYSSQYPYRIRQQELHLESDISLGNGFRIEPAFHILKINYNNISYRYSKENITDITFLDSITPRLDTVVVQKELYSLQQKDTGFTNYVISLGLSKSFSVYNLMLNGSYSNLNKKKQLQIGGSFTYYPFGNLDFYGTSSVTGFFQGRDKRLLLGQTLGGRIFKRFWLEGNIIYGNLTNANIANGSIVYNNADKIDYRIGGTLIWLLSKHVELSLIYQYFQKESSTLYYEFDEVAPDTHTQIETLNQKYHTNSIIIGIKWKL